MSNHEKEPVSGGLLYNYETRQLEYEDGREVGPFTFYLPTWRPTIFFFWQRHERFLNPQHFATEETRDIILKWLRKTFKTLVFTPFDNRNSGVSHPCWTVRVEQFGEEVGQHVVGLLAMRLQVSGDAWAKTMLRDELKQTGAIL